MLVGLFKDFRAELDLVVCGYPKNRAINRIAYPKLNPPTLGKIPP